MNELENEIKELNRDIVWFLRTNNGIDNTLLAILNELDDENKRARLLIESATTLHEST